MPSYRLATSPPQLALRAAPAACTKHSTQRFWAGARGLVPGATGVLHTSSNATGASAESFVQSRTVFYCYAAPVTQETAERVTGKEN